MSGLFDNFIANMYGPHFLIFYVIWILGIFWFVLRQLKKFSSVVFEPDLLPGKVNPYEIASLRGVDGLLSAIVFRLLHLGLLKPDCATAGALLVQDTKAVQSHQQILSTLDQKVLQHFSTPQPLLSARNYVAGPFFHHLEQLQKEGLVVSEANVYWMRKAGWLGFYAILGMGLYKLIAALWTGHSNVFFLLLMIFLSGVMYFYLIICHRIGFFGQKKIHLTNKGVHFLGALKKSLTPLQKNKSLLQETLQHKEENTLLLMMTLFGFSALLVDETAAFTPLLPPDMQYSYETGTMLLAQGSMRHNKEDSGGGSIGGCSAGSGCSGGGGCGGGCGGCG